MSNEVPKSPERWRLEDEEDLKSTEDEEDFQSRLNQKLSPEAQALYQELSPEAQALYSISLHEASEKIFDAVDQLPAQWPNREALREHVAAIRTLLPPLREEWE
jgi:hypothetical protein